MKVNPFAAYAMRGRLGGSQLALMVAGRAECCQPWPGSKVKALRCGLIPVGWSPLGAVAALNAGVRAAADVSDGQDESCAEYAIK